MTLATDIASVKSPSLRKSLTDAAPIAMPGALAVLIGAMMQPLKGVRPIADGLSASVAGQTLSLHQRADQVTLKINGLACAVATSLAELEDAFFDTLFDAHRAANTPMALAA
jgi:cellobiose-specific phosphotransferase system component IIC